MANLFSKIASLLNEKPSDSIMDDNAAISAVDNNPYMSSVVLGARNAYDTLHTLMNPLIKGKKSSLKQIDKWLKDWTERLQKIVDMYEELLAKLNDMGADFGGMFDIEFAKEAWEIVQDTPILRRYMGEANYWLLYDTVGILATQPGQIAGDLAAGVKEAVRQAILALLSMTDGLLCLESYLGMIQQYWGALYLKITPIPLLDSIVPNVTTAYWYKPAIPSQSRGEQHSITLRNAPPGQGFTPLPMPIPDPIMVTRDSFYLTRFDYKNPDTWYLNGTPYYLPNTMNLLERALQYWSSSYTNEFMPALNNFYPRNDYGEGSAHPLRVGHTLAQLDTDKMVLNGTNVVSTQEDISEETSEESNPSIKEMFADVFTDDIVQFMTAETWTDAYGNVHNGWQYAYEKAYNLLYNFIQSQLDVYGVEDKNIAFADFVALQENYIGTEGYIGLGEFAMDWDGEFYKAVVDMYASWRSMVTAYSVKMGMSGENAFNYFFDAVMKVFVDAGHTVSGADGSLEEFETFMVGPSFNPTNLSSSGSNVGAGVTGIAYKVNTKNNQIIYISSGSDVTAEGDSVTVEYPASDVGFIMFPSDNATDDILLQRTYSANYIMGTLSTTMLNVSEGLHKAEAVLNTEPLTPSSASYANGTQSYITGYINGDSVNDDATVLTQYFSQDGTNVSPDILGSLPDALYKHKSCLPHIPKWFNSKKTEAGVGNLFFPDGKIPTSISVPETFVMLYQSYVPETYVAHYADPDAEPTVSAVEELADVVGYSINKGREIKFPCFGIYGDLLSMQSWHYTEMPYTEFATTYAQTKSGSNLYYEKNNPGHIIYYHSSYMSQVRQMQMAVIHEYLESTTKSYGSGDTYTFYVFPTESISVSKLTDSPSLGKFLSTDAESPSGEAYHYITMRNPIPKCAKYVDPEKWSIMDIIHEMYLLASNLAGLCGDNGERLKQLQDDLSEFHISTPQFIGQLPENNGQFVPFRFEIFKDYSDQIEKFVNSIYDFRAKIIAATEAW